MGAFGRSIFSSGEYWERKTQLVNWCAEEVSDEDDDEDWDDEYDEEEDEDEDDSDWD